MEHFGLALDVIAGRAKADTVCVSKDSMSDWCNVVGSVVSISQSLTIDGKDRLIELMERVYSQCNNLTNGASNAS